VTDLAEIASLEAFRAPNRPAPAPTGRRRTLRIRISGRVWAGIWTVAVLWSLAGLLAETDGIVNPEGFPQLGEFWSGALRPDLSGEFLSATLDATLTTVAFGVLGTGLSIVIGLSLAVLMSQTWWAPTTGARPERMARLGALGLSRGACGLPRGVHEAVWGLLLVSVLGRDPLVGVLAIGIPFGAMTAKVYSEILDEADHRPYEVLRTAGAGRLTALAYGILPTTLPALTSYAFYRFECSIRSAVILGMIGAGGLGLQLSLSFQGLQYAEMWTSLYALVALGAVIDRWGAWLRGGRVTGSSVTGRRRWTLSLLGGTALGIASVVHLAPDLSRWFSARTLELLRGLVDDLLPPRLPAGGWGELLSRSLETVQMSIVAITVASTFGVAVALLAARSGGSYPRRLASWSARTLLLVTRAIPPPVWALLVLLVTFPGPLPGALALGVYTFGILGRLFAEVVEELDPRPAQALTQLGAGPTQAFAYATAPAAVGQLVAYSLYRWEVTARETVIVGVVGAGGLGRLLEQQRAGFDYPAMTTTVLALIAVSLLVDFVCVGVRRSLR
jgi:phosphonate transport system permease protein